MCWESLVRALTEIRLNLKCGTNNTSLRISLDLRLMSPLKLTGTRVWFGKVTNEFFIELIETKWVALEQICLVALESTIKYLLEVKIGSNDTEKHILVAYKVVGTSS